MNEENLELLITLDDPVGAQEEDIFNYLHVRNNLEYWLNQRFLASQRFEQPADAVGDNDQIGV